ncbi:hypothetical protein [Rhodoplanes sp. Z2-YC6860]|uniref:hypothetical protein n=1 Tax=Rhodoplanes sp. Z2-YC6860 TaxID=674703 RepID=UPI000834352D|nr:hypothetical protein [Rhodoplanes sp. Z2-YC6860]
MRDARQQLDDVDGTPVPDPLVEPVKPGLLVCALPVVLGTPLLPIGGEPLATEPQGRPIASVRPVLFSEFVVDGLFIVGFVLVVPGVDGVMPVVPGVEVDGLVGTIADGALVPPPMPVVPLVPAEPLLEPDDAPPEAPPAPPAPPPAPPPPPPPAAIAKPALPARRIAAINETA